MLPKAANKFTTERIIMPMKKKKTHVPADTVNFADATGAIDYCFTNDYMFRAILQKNKRVLKALICSLLRLSPNDISSITITNPIELGKSIDDKDFILDITILMNDSTFINLETPYISDSLISPHLRSIPNSMPHIS